MEEASEVREAYANETRKGVTIQVGDLVFLRKGYVERPAVAASQKLLSKSDGPYEVEELPTPQNAVLVDPLTKQRIDACKGGRTVAVDRLIYYPVAPAELESVERGVEDEELRALQRFDVVAVEEGEVVIIGQVENNRPEQANLTVHPLEGIGRGRLRDRQWSVTGEARLVGYREVVARLTLDPTGTLSAESLEELSAEASRYDSMIE